MNEVLRPQYLRIRNWEQFQHYKNRRPPWIKYLISSLSDYELHQLPVPTRLLYKELLLVAAVTDNNIPHDPVWIAAETHMEHEDVVLGVATLVTAGFLGVSGNKRSASKAIARRAQKASPNAVARVRVETETDAETDQEKEQPKAVDVVRPPARPLALERPGIAHTIDQSLRGAA